MIRSFPIVNRLSNYLRVFFIVSIILCSSQAFSQPDSSLIEKFSPNLRIQAAKAPHSREEVFVIQASDPEAFRVFMGKTIGVFPGAEYRLAGVFLVRASWKLLLDSILTRPGVRFIDQLRVPREELAVSNLDISANKANLLHARFPSFNGEGMTVSVKENRPDTTDIDLRGRYIHTPYASSIVSGHANIMATIIAGAGNTYYEGKGVSPGAFISSADFATLLPEPDAAYQQYGITVQNHSYGTAIENYYGADALAYDASVVTRPALLHVFSSGNAGTQASTAGPYAGISSFANLTGSFKMAKNIITVGHTDSLGNVLLPSSRGPAYDGRVKPELVAFGEDGSSGAAAIVSGIALSLQDGYREQFGINPPSSLVKALLLNSADDVGPQGIDFSSGYGAANAFRAMNGLTRGLFFTGEVAQGMVATHQVTIPAGIKKLKITLVWNDPPASPNAAKALRNDLDLELSLPAASQQWLPWVLSHFPHPDSLQQLPQRKRDSLNNVELVSLDLPAPGDYEIRIKGFDVPASSPQSYSLVYQLDTLDTFNWYYPSASDNIFPRRENTLRWHSGFTATTGSLSYSLDDGASWQIIGNNIDLDQGYFKWTAPDTFATALLRMSISPANFVSDTFTISNRISTAVGFNCPDSFLLYWPRIPGVDAYRVYRLGEKYMEPIITTTDTAVVLQKLSNPFLHYAVAPIMNNRTGVRGYGFNYTTQGVECYIRSFLVSLNGSDAHLDLLLGTLYNIERIVVEKFDGTSFIAIQSISVIPGISISFIDPSLLQGANIYRIRVELAGGGVVYSQPATLYYLGDAEYILFPNPVQQGQPLNVLLSDNAGLVRLQIMNAMGQKVQDVIINDIRATIPTSQLAKGLYLCRFINEAGHASVLRLVVQ